MESQVIILVLSFLVLLLLDVPIAIAIGVSTYLAVLSLAEVPTGYIVAQRMTAGIGSFPLLAIPFFILAGILMGEGGMARRLIDFAASVVGRFNGGLSYVSVLTCMMFGAISGSATAAVSSIGGFMIPEMTKNGYDRRFSVAVTTTAATTGLVIPPSNIMIVYAVVVGKISVAAMFMAGVIPGVIVGLAIMAVAGVISVRHGYGGGKKCTFGEILQNGGRAALSLLLVVIVLAGIILGVFTATEAAAIAVLYAFVLAVLVYREVKWKDLPRILLRCGITTSVIMLLVGTSQAMSWILTYQDIPQSVSAALLGLSSNPLVILLIINILLLIVGTFMDMTPAVLIFTPIFLPVVVGLGMDPIHFGIMMIVNLCIGICTPPVGTCLFVGCGVGKTTIAEVTRPMLPFFFAMVVALMLITYIPSLTMWLPETLPQILSAIFDLT